MLSLRPFLHAMIVVCVGAAGLSPAAFAQAERDDRAPVGQEDTDGGDDGGPRREDDDVGDAPEDVVDAPQDGALAGIEMGTFRVGSASPQGKRLGVGLELGWPTAVTGKLMLRPEQAIRASVGAFSGLVLTEPVFSATVDWLYHPFTIARAPGWTLHSHVGAGGALVVLPIAGKRTTLPAALYSRGPTQVWTGLRAPLGVDLAFSDVPVDVVVDVVPTFLTFPGLGVGFGASLGARWWW